MKALAFPFLAMAFAVAPVLAADEKTPPLAQDPNKVTESQQQQEPHRNDCLRETGSRIRRSKGECLSQAGHSYGDDDVRRSGANDAGQALRLLDPSLTVQRQ